MRPRAIGDRIAAFGRGQLDLQVRRREHAGDGVLPVEDVDLLVVPRPQVDRQDLRRRLPGVQSASCSRLDQVGGASTSGRAGTAGCPGCGAG